MTPLSNPQIRVLKARAQRLKATFKLGKEGATPAFVAALDQALKERELVKIRVIDPALKLQKDELAVKLAEQTGSHLVTRLGHVIVLYRSKPEA